jgi:glycolate oxidase FAD binding subunit
METVTRDALRPSNADDIQAALMEADATGSPLRVIGGGTRRSMTSCVAASARELDLSAISGITNYEPEELVLSLRAGTPLHEVEAALAERGQMLAFDPPDYAALLGAGAARTTIGGIVGTGFAGPRRLSSGNVRDHVLGFDAVSGRGEKFRAGGRVIKNVTGYDLAKLMVGSWGTLAVVTDLSLRALPRPQYEATLLVEQADASVALAGIRAALASPLEVSCAALLPDGRSAIRLEGFRASVEERHRQILKTFESRGSVHAVEEAESAALWRDIRDVAVFASDARVVWRLSLPSQSAAVVVAAIAKSAACSALYDWGGSLVWLAMEGDAAADLVRGETSKFGGHAWLMRAPDAMRERVATAPPLDAGTTALSRRIKSGFDPLNRLGNGPFAPGTNR